MNNHKRPSLEQARKLLPNNEDYIQESSTRVLKWRGVYKIESDVFEGNPYRRQEPNLYHRQILEEVKDEFPISTNEAQYSNNTPDEKDNEELVFEKYEENLPTFANEELKDSVESKN